jgi:phosphate transport system substrate-binding protein
LDGSDTFQTAMQQLTTDYTSQCPNSGAAFTVNGNGSKVGLDALVNGSLDLAYSDVTSVGRAGLVDYQVAAFIYVVAVNSDTQVTNLSTTQLQGIYTGKITNWSQVGGVDEPIQIITRSAGSPIRAIFEAYVLKGVHQTVGGISLGGFDSSDMAAQDVANTSGAISYVPLSALPLNGIQALTIGGVNASASMIASGSYPFWSIIHLYSKQSVKGLALSLISFCFTEAGTTDLSSTGIVPVKQLTRAILSSHMPGPVV